MEKAARKLYPEWVGLWQEEWVYLSKGNFEEALRIHNNQGKDKAGELEAKLEQLAEYATKRANKFSADAQTSQNQSTVLLIVVFFIGTLGCAVMTTLITKSILSSILLLKTSMNVSAKEGKLIEASIKGKNEITEMAEDYNYLLRTLIRSSWLSEGKNSFRSVISDVMKIDEFAEKVLSFIARYTNAGSAVFYLNDGQDCNLSLVGSYAYTERDFLQNECKLGDGYYRTSGKRKKPILLKNVKRK